MRNNEALLLFFSIMKNVNRAAEKNNTSIKRHSEEMVKQKAMNILKRKQRANTNSINSFV